MAHNVDKGVGLGVAVTSMWEGPTMLTRVLAGVIPHVGKFVGRAHNAMLRVLECSTT